MSQPLGPRASSRSSNSRADPQSGFDPDIHGVFPATSKPIERTRCWCQGMAALAVDQLFHRRRGINRRWAALSPRSSRPAGLLGRGRWIGVHRGHVQRHRGGVGKAGQRFQPSRPHFARIPDYHQRPDVRAGTGAQVPRPDCQLGWPEHRRLRRAAGIVSRSPSRSGRAAAKQPGGHRPHHPAAPPPRSLRLPRSLRPSRSLSMPASSIRLSTRSSVRSSARRKSTAPPAPPSPPAASWREVS